MQRNFASETIGEVCKQSIDEWSWSRGQALHQWFVGRHQTSCREIWGSEAAINYCLDHPNLPVHLDIFRALALPNKCSCDDGQFEVFLAHLLRSSAPAQINMTCIMAKLSDHLRSMYSLKLGVFQFKKKSSMFEVRAVWQISEGQHAKPAATSQRSLLGSQLIHLHKSCS